MKKFVDFLHAQMWAKGLLKKQSAIIAAKVDENKYVIAYSYRQAMNDSAFKGKELYLVHSQPAATTEFVFTERIALANDLLKQEVQKIGSTLVDHFIISPSRNFTSLAAKGIF